jgi:glycosyltransferase involved in cell wall biosynthesis
MKVLVVTEPGVDGVFRYVETLCHFLVKRGREVHLAYSDRRGSDRLPRLVDWVEEHGGMTVNLRTSNRPAPSDWGAFCSLLKLARTVKPDVIHSHSSKAGFLARSLKFFGIRAVQFYHPHAYVGMRPVPGRLDWIYNMIESGLGRIAYTITVSLDEMAFACQRLKIPTRRVFLKGNGVYTDLFTPPLPGEKLRLRKAMGLPLHQPILGFIGRSSVQKDPLTLYRAFAKVAAEKPVSLFHVGQGELDSQLDILVGQSGLGHRVFRSPYMATPADFYRVVDGFILTSLYEGFSLAVMEAISANLPMILSEAPGNVDLLGQSLSHLWTAKPGDVEGFSRCIANWHEKLQTGAPVNHREIARTQFDCRKRVGAVVKLYDELARPATINRDASHSGWAGIGRLRRFTGQKATPSRPPRQNQPDPAHRLHERV